MTMHNGQWDQETRAMIEDLQAMLAALRQNILGLGAVQRASIGNIERRLARLEAQARAREFSRN